ncbi:MAG: hypothetical protein ACOX4G_05755 [Limnochordia bacterium]
MRKTFTKSIRLSQQEADEMAYLTTLLSASSEASLLKEALLRGVMEKKIEAAVQRYLRRDLSVGEVAELYRIPTHILVRALQERRIPMLDVTQEEAVTTLEALRVSHGLSADGTK